MKDEQNTSARPLSLRGRTFIGKVISAKAQKTATVEWERRIYIPKYQRYEKRRTRVHVHNPEDMDAVEGDIVKIMETRKISKTKSFIIIEIINKDSKKE